mmetsp:Transcript_29215/g.75230  ORF Transcript_29215/g.75230 Transcript_29215/m.75230 type:complete len:202 (-) Transcript_29215:2079-2684(-)
MPLPDMFDCPPPPPLSMLGTHIVPAFAYTPNEWTERVGTNLSSISALNTLTSTAHRILSSSYVQVRRVSAKAHRCGTRSPIPAEDEVKRKERKGKKACPLTFNTDCRTTITFFFFSSFSFPFSFPFSFSFSFSFTSSLLFFSTFLFSTQQNRFSLSTLHSFSSFSLSFKLEKAIAIFSVLPIQYSICTACTPSVPLSSSRL